MAVEINGLLLVSGGLGMIKKQSLRRAGTGGRLVKIWNSLQNEKINASKREKFLIIYIPEPLCWTEVPSSMRIFIRQRIPGHED
jgi:hypothetical protein